MKKLTIFEQLKLVAAKNEKLVAEYNELVEKYNAVVTRAQELEQECTELQSVAIRNLGDLFEMAENPESERSAAIRLRLLEIKKTATAEVKQLQPEVAEAVTAEP